MNINEVKVTVLITVNGATIQPNNEQLLKIREQVLSTVFERKPLVINTVKRTYRKKVRKEAWSEEQVKYAKLLKEEGKSTPRIAAIMNQVFHTHRSDKSISLMFWNHKNGRHNFKKAGGSQSPILDKVERVNESPNPFSDIEL